MGAVSYLAALAAATPSQEDIRAARAGAGLSQAAAAKLVHLSTPGRWSEYERGVMHMERSRFELFLLLTNQHPHYGLHRRDEANALPADTAKAPARGRSGKR